MNPSLITNLQKTVDLHGIDLDVDVLVRAYEKHKASTGFGSKKLKTQKFGPFELYVSAYPFSGELILATILSDVEDAVAANFRQTMLAAGKDLYVLAPEVFENESESLAFVSTLLAGGMSEEALPEDKINALASQLVQLNVAGWMEFKEQLEARTLSARKKLSSVGKATRAVIEFFTAARSVSEELIEPEDFLLLDDDTMDRLRAFVRDELGKKKSAINQSKQTPTQ